MEIEKEFETRYGDLPECVAYAPGRIEVLGNHTDYNSGVALSGALDYGTKFAMKRTLGNSCVVYDMEYHEIATFDKNCLSTTEEDHWSDYFKGLLSVFSEMGVKIEAFNACLHSSVPSGAGMSSSAALLISAAIAFAKVFGNGKFSDYEIIRIAQRVENEYLGIDSGLLDQMTSVFGKENKLLLSDFKTNSVDSYISFPDEYVFLIADSGVRHKLVDSEYNQCRKLCDEALNALRNRDPRITSLSDATISDLDNIKTDIPKRVYKKALHVLGENRRVIQAVKSLSENDMRRFGSLLYASHESSKSLFENSCSELDLLVELSQSIPGCLGARLSGAGFGGITIHLLKKENVFLYSKRLNTAFEIQTGNKLSIKETSIANGASLI